MELFLEVVAAAPCWSARLFMQVASAHYFASHLSVATVTVGNSNLATRFLTFESPSHRRRPNSIVLSVVKLVCIRMRVSGCSEKARFTSTRSSLVNLIREKGKLRSEIFYKLSSNFLTSSFYSCSMKIFLWIIFTFFPNV